MRFPKDALPAIAAYLNSKGGDFFRLQLRLLTPAPIKSSPGVSYTEQMALQAARMETIQQIANMLDGVAAGTPQTDERAGWVHDAQYTPDDELVR